MFSFSFSFLGENKSNPKQKYENIYIETFSLLWKEVFARTTIARKHLRTLTLLFMCVSCAFHLYSVRTMH